MNFVSPQKKSVETPAEAPAGPITEGARPTAKAEKKAGKKEKKEEEEEEEEEDETAYVVEKLLDVRWRRGKQEFLVKWKARSTDKAVDDLFLGTWVCYQFSINYIIYRWTFIFIIRVQGYPNEEDNSWEPVGQFDGASNRRACQHYYFIQLSARRANYRAMAASRRYPRHAGFVA